MKSATITTKKKGVKVTAKPKTNRTTQVDASATLPIMTVPLN